MNVFIDLYREAVNGVNRTLSMINQKYANDDLLQDTDARERYNREIVDAINERLLNIAVYRGFSYPKAQNLKVTYNTASGMYDLSSGLNGGLFMEPERDRRGQVVRVWLPEPYLIQSEKATKQFLAHYGVKGMKWGVRRKRGPDGRVPSTPASGDAKKAEKIRAKAKMGGTNALTNKELQTAITRMNLEVNYSRLNDQTRKKSIGEKAIQFLMKDVAETEVKRVVKGQSAITVEKALKSRGQTDLANRIKPKKK